MKRRKLLVATTNPAKFKRYKNILAVFSNIIEVVSLNSINLKFKVEENGLTAEENARKKAREYACRTGLPVLTVDEVLYVDAFLKEEQPGINVRRCVDRKREVSDEELLEYFLKKLYGVPLEKRTCRWVFAICLATPEGKEVLGAVELHELFAEESKLPMLPGYPLSSLLYNPDLEKYQVEYTPEEEKERLHGVYEKVRELVKEVFQLE
jgi:XTP/dITP diphosphohydrolase